MVAKLPWSGNFHFEQYRQYIGESMKLNEEIVCKDGFIMSVQAHEGAYCHPRKDNAPRYTAVEVGYPSSAEPLLIAWAEDENKPMNTVYPYVPATQVSLVCAKHGGVVSGELPAGIPRLEATNASR
jgi:hypothetical protein